METHAFEATVQLSDSQLQPQLEQSLKWLRQARYKQAVRSLDDALRLPSGLVQRLQILAYRALTHALWKKPELAIDDATHILTTVQADTDMLFGHEIDWEHEKAQDTGYLAFLADVYQLRGSLWLLRQNPRRSVEDLSLSIFMTAGEADNALNYLQRATALIELQDCFERALEDLRLSQQLAPQLVQESFHLPKSGEFFLAAKGIGFRQGDREIWLTPDKVRPKLNKVGADWFRIAQGLDLS